MSIGQWFKGNRSEFNSKQESLEIKFTVPLREGFQILKEGSSKKIFFFNDDTLNADPIFLQCERISGIISCRYWECRDQTL